MRTLFFGLLLAMPIIEIALFVVVGQAIGLWPTIAAVIGAGLIGAMLLRWQGVQTLMAARRAAAAGQMPAREMANVMLIAIAGFLLLLPGFLSDILALLLLVPPVRTAIIGLFAARMVVASPFRRPDPPRTIELEDDGFRDR